MEIFERPLELVQDLPVEWQAKLVIRHSARYPIVNQDEVYTVGLTPQGITQAEKLGGQLARLRRPGRLMSSPVGRCQDTARGIARGANWPLEVVSDVRLSHPFIEPAWNSLPFDCRQEPMPEQVAQLLDMLFDADDTAGTLDLFVTHDTILAVLAGYFTGLHFTYPDYWPEYLEGILFWRNSDQVHLRWRERIEIIGAWPVPGARQLDLGF